MTQRTARFAHFVLAAVALTVSASVEAAAPAEPPSWLCVSVPISAPPDGETPAGERYTYAANDCAVGDLDGDGKSELMVKTAFYSDDGKYLRIYLSCEDTPYRFWSFMQDPVYRIAVANQNIGYNACPQPGFYFGRDLPGHGIWFRGCYLE